MGPPRGDLGLRSAGCSDVGGIFVPDRIQTCAEQSPGVFVEHNIGQENERDEQKRAGSRRYRKIDILPLPSSTINSANSKECEEDLGRLWWRSRPEKHPLLRLGRVRPPRDGSEHWLQVLLFLVVGIVGIVGIVALVILLILLTLLPLCPVLLVDLAFLLLLLTVDGWYCCEDCGCLCFGASAVTAICCCCSFTCEGLLAESVTRKRAHCW